MTSARWVDDGKFVTSSGVSAGLDMSLHVVERLFGTEKAERLANLAEYEWPATRPGIPSPSGTGSKLAPRLSRHPSPKRSRSPSQIQVFATPNGQYVYVANQGTGTSPDDTVSVIETASNRVVATVKTGRGAHGVVISDDGALAFVANTFEGTASIIDTATRTVVDNIKVGEGPGGITFRAATR